jgi:hypothetical protein
MHTRTRARARTRARQPRPLQQPTTNRALAGAAAPGAASPVPLLAGVSELDIATHPDLTPEQKDAFAVLLDPFNEDAGLELVCEELPQPDELSGDAAAAATLSQARALCPAGWWRGARVCVCVGGGGWGGGVGWGAARQRAAAGPASLLLPACLLLPCCVPVVACQHRTHQARTHAPAHAHTFTPPPRPPTHTRRPRRPRSPRSWPTTARPRLMRMPCSQRRRS